ncbi:hypothetical protein ACFQPF_07135 [Fictibacillus iocasae]|uniref:Uncharacterized protein n=1 Tax=Fictibacillus iocasae TaxID=2715437 RepID=A0ABW2NPV2_9BACL
MLFTEKVLHTPETPATIIDADYRAEYGVIVAERRNRRRSFYHSREKLTLSLSISFSKVRWMNADTIVLADTRPKNADDKNVHIVSLTDGVQDSFHGGSCIQDIVVTRDGIWISYFDEGVFGEGVSTGGGVLFSLKGDVLYSFNHHNHKEIIIDDCYAVCSGDDDDIWLFPYHSFPLVRFSYKNKETAVFPVSEKLHGASAIAVRESQAFFHGAYDHKQSILGTSLHGASEIKNVADYGMTNGYVRGLAPECGGAAFIRISKHVSLLHLA